MTVQAITSKNRSSSSATGEALASALAESERVSAGLAAKESAITVKDADERGAGRAGGRPAPTEMSEEDIDLVVEEMRQSLRDNATNLDFAIDRSSGRVVVKIIDRTNGEVLRQLPSEEMLALHESLERMVGVLVSTRV